MKKKGVVAVVCIVVIGMQSIVPLAAQQINMWKTSFQENLLSKNDTESFLINKTSVTLAVGEKTELKVTDHSGKEFDSNSLEWKSSDSDIASISSTGKVTAKKDGKATITAKLDQYTAVCEVTVKTELKDIRIMPTELDLEEGKKASLSVICTPSNISNIPEITWSSDNEEVVEVDDRGNLTAKKPGTATVTVQVGEFKKTSNITVKEKEVAVEAIQFVDKKVILGVGESETLDLIFDPDNTTVKSDVQWTSSHTNIVSVDKNGTITANAVGSAVITAKVSGKKASCEVTVEEKAIPLETIKLSSSTLELEIGKKETLTVSYDPEDTTDSKTIIWTSSDKSIVSVDEKGNVEGLKEGKATITAEVSGKKVSCEINVKKQAISLESISFEEDELLLKEGDEKQLEVIYKPNNTTVEKNVIWTSSDETVVSVTDGIVKAIGIGEAVIMP